MQFRFKLFELFSRIHRTDLIDLYKKKLRTMQFSLFEVHENTHNVFELC